MSPAPGANVFPLGHGGVFVCWVGCLTSQKHAIVSRGRICSGSFTCCHTEIEVADQTFHLTQSQYTDTGQTSPSADHLMPGAWQGSHWSANFEVTGITRPGKKSCRHRDGTGRGKLSVCTVTALTLLCLPRCKMRKGKDLTLELDSGTRFKSFHQTQ